MVSILDEIGGGSRGAAPEKYRSDGPLNQTQNPEIVLV